MSVGLRTRFSGLAAKSTQPLCVLYFYFSLTRHRSHPVDWRVSQLSKAAIEVQPPQYVLCRGSHHAASQGRGLGRKGLFEGASIAAAAAAVENLVFSVGAVL